MTYDEHGRGSDDPERNGGERFWIAVVIIAVIVCWFIVNGTGAGPSSSDCTANGVSVAGTC